MGLQLFKDDTKIMRVANSAVAAQSEVDSSILDMAGYDGVVFVAALGDVADTCVLTLKVEQNTADSTSGMAALSGNATFTAGASNADNKLLVVDVIRPNERYVRAGVDAHHGERSRRRHLRHPVSRVR